MVFLYIIIFIFSCFILAWAGSWLVRAIVKIAKYLGWREFVVAFFVMAFTASLPNLFVGISAALRNIPELSFGDIVGGNVVDLTLVAALAVLFKHRNLSANSRMVQASALFTTGAAILPLLLVFDGKLSRGDGLVLLFIFAIYAFWLFSKKERFRKVYNGEYEEKKSLKGFFDFLKNLAKIIVLLVIIVLASQGIVGSASFFSASLGISLATVGILIVGLGNCFPEIYFSIAAAKKGQNWLILGDLMGSVIVCSTLVLGIVALIAPINISDFSPFLIARIFTVAAALFFFTAVKTDKKITKKEGFLLLVLYLLFVILEIFFN